MTFLYFVSGKLAMSTLKDYALLVKLFYKNNAFSPLALKKFRIFNGMKKEIHPMLVQGLLKMIQKFKKTVFFLCALW